MRLGKNPAGPRRDSRLIGRLQPTAGAQSDLREYTQWRDVQGVIRRFKSFCLLGEDGDTSSDDGKTVIGRSRVDLRKREEGDEVEDEDEDGEAAQ